MRVNALSDLTTVAARYHEGHATRAELYRAEMIAAAAGVTAEEIDRTVRGRSPREEPIR